MATQDKARRLRQAISDRWARHVLLLGNQIVFDGGDNWGVRGHNNTWLFCSEPCDDIRVLQRACEGIALLQLLARLDARCFLRALVPMGFEVGVPASDSRNTKKERSFGLVLAVSRALDIVPLSDRIVGVTQASDEFLRDYAKFAPVGAEVPRIPLTIFLRDELLGTRSRGKLLHQVLQLAMIQFRASQVSTTRTDSINYHHATQFELVGVRSYTFMSSPPDSSLFPCLVRIVKNRVRVLDLTYLDLSNMSVLATPDFFHVLLPPQLIASACDVKHVRVSELTSAQLIPFVFSSFLVNTTVTSVEIKAPSEGEPDSAETRQKLWEWAAFALFSQFSTNNVSTVYVDLKTVEGVDLGIVHAVATSNNPAALLSGLEASSIQRQISSLRYFRKATRDLDSQLIVCEDSVIETQQSLSALEIDLVDHTVDGVFRVLLPGFGVCWVKQSDIDAASTSGASQVTRSIESLELDNLTDATCDRCVEMLRALPCIIESIKVIYQHSPISLENWCRGLFSACPGLKVLSAETNVEVDDLNIFVEYAEAGTCRLNELYLENLVDIGHDGVKSFFGALCDESHPLAQCLECVEINLNCEDDVYENGSVEAEGGAVGNRVSPIATFSILFHEMLEKNRRLQLVSIVLYRACECMPKLFDQDVAVRDASLDLDSKVAFLSIFWSHSSTPALPVLDTSVLSLIFQFAAHTTRRKVRIRYEDYIGEDSDDESD